MVGTPHPGASQRRGHGLRGCPLRLCPNRISDHARDAKGPSGTSHLAPGGFPRYDQGEIPGLGTTRPWSNAKTTAAARSLSPSLVNKWPMWVFTVPSPI